MVLPHETENHGGFLQWNSVGNPLSFESTQAVVDCHTRRKFTADFLGDWGIFSRMNLFILERLLRNHGGNLPWYVNTQRIRSCRTRRISSVILLLTNHYVSRSWPSSAYSMTRYNLRAAIFWINLKDPSCPRISSSETENHRGNPQSFPLVG